MKITLSDNLPSALKSKQKIMESLGKKEPAIFLDYDGTLTPIVSDPQKAFLPQKTRELLRKLSAYWIVAIMSGRALSDVKHLVGLENITYAGSHGFNIVGPEESFHEQRGNKFLPVLNSAEKEIQAVVKDMPGVHVERKPYAITVHYRQAAESIVPELEQRVDEVAGHNPDLLKTLGKKIFELRPRVNWNKGKALVYLLKQLHIDESRVVPIYIGDDLTDEDAFKAVANRGIGILVKDSNRPTAAHYTVNNTDEVAAFLETLLSLVESESSANIWALRYTAFKPEAEKLRETLCTVGNGYFATRGAAPESVAGEIHYPGTYVAGLYNRLNSTVAGKTVENESLVNVPNWLALTFSIDDDTLFDLRAVKILDYVQELDMLRGVLVRTVRFEDAKKRQTTLTQRRFSHMQYKHIGGLETTLTAENWSGTVHVQSALDGRIKNTLVERYRSLNNSHLVQIDAGLTESQLLWMQVETNQSHIRIAEAARTVIDYDGHLVEKTGEIVREDGFIGQEFDLDVQPGKALRIEKIASIYSSRDFAISESLIQAQAELLRRGTFAELLESHVLAWKHLWEFWKIEFNTENLRSEMILNLHIFHLLQTVSPNTVGLDVGVPPRGLHGEAYRGLIMWDELFIFPLFNLRMPEITRSLLMYRYRRLPWALWAAQTQGRQGAMFPWQSGSDGQEQAQSLHLNPASGRWIVDNSQLERHIDLAVAYNVWQYYQVTGDDDFMAFYGAKLLAQIARYWASKAQFNREKGRYEILKVMGPDEFHDRYPGNTDPGINNNAYTNLMVAWTYNRTLQALGSLTSNQRALLMDDTAITKGELDHWDEIRRKLYIPFNSDGIISQFEGYDELKEFDWDGYRAKYGNIQRLDRILEAENDSPNNYKVSKQADLLMLFYLLSADELRKLFNQLGYPFEHDTIPKNVEYYLKRTSHGSTLSRVVHAWVLSRSQREISWHLFQEALESDIEDIQGGTTREGIHLGAMAGTVDLILRCYSGVENRGEILWFNPSLPSEIKSLKFSIKYRKNWVDVYITSDKIRLHNQADAVSPTRIGFADSVFLLAPGDTKEFTFDNS